MIKAAAERGWIDSERAMLEATISIKRAGADIILSYAAADLAGVLEG
jgi:porphobilinogen synthase